MSHLLLHIYILSNNKRYWHLKLLILLVKNMPYVNQVTLNLRSKTISSAILSHKTNVRDYLFKYFKTYVLFYMFTCLRTDQAIYFLSRNNILRMMVFKVSIKLWDTLYHLNCKNCLPWISLLSLSSPYLSPSEHPDHPFKA